MRAISISIAISIALVGAAFVVGGCRSSSSNPPAPEPAASAALAVERGGEALNVPRTTGPIHIDGELDEDTWRSAARTGAFVDAHGDEARPFSDARFLADDAAIYAVLYAADDDLRATVKDHDGPVWMDSAFIVTLGLDAPGAPTFEIDVSAAGVVSDARRGKKGERDASWESGIEVALDRDGTMNDASDEDEEWVVEARIPLVSLGISSAKGARVRASVSRCDVPRAGGPRRCGSLGAGRTLVLGS
jgi:hypothetical protein